MVHCPLEAKCLSPPLFAAGLREKCISRSPPHALPNSVEKPEEEDVVSRGGQSHEGSGDGGKGISEEDDPLSSLKSVGEPS